MDEATDALLKDKPGHNRMMWRKDCIFDSFQSLAKGR